MCILYFFNYFIFVNIPFIQYFIKHVLLRDNASLRAVSSVTISIQLVALAKVVAETGRNNEKHNLFDLRFLTFYALLAATWPCNAAESATVPYDDSE